MDIFGPVPPREEGLVDLLVGVDHGFAHTGYTIDKDNLVSRHSPVGWIFYDGSRKGSVAPAESI